MDRSDFVHLHVHSDYSLLDGLAQVGDLMKRTVECGQQAIALTDHGTVSGAINFYKAAKKAGVKPILGCEVYQSLGSMKERKRGYNHLTILAKNDVGWKNLSRITSLANMEGFYYRPRVDFETLKAHSEGLIVLSGCLKGPVPVLLQQDKYDEARALASECKEVFGDDYYLEVQPNSLEQQKVVNEGCFRLAKELDIKPVATCDLHYVYPSDAPAQEVRICIASGKTLSNENRLKMKEDFFFRTSEEMFQSFADFPEAILATREIAEKVCDYDLLPGLRNDYFLPNFLPPDGSDCETYFDRCCKEGLKKRYGKPSKEAMERLEYEMDVIKSLGFITYFLIVSDFIAWARNNDCAVGPGRGSAAGSIVAYCLWITDIDPLRYDLLFERFLNPARVTMPDIDVDFCEANRSRVIDYVRDKYGAETVCQIITFGTLKPKAVIKDVGRVLEIPYGDVDRISKLIPEGPKLKSLEQAFQESPELNALRDDSRYKKLFELALCLEGINRHQGKHAAGVVISDIDLKERIPLTLVKGDKTTQFTMTEVEEVGLLKMDFLGLRTLTLIEEAVRLIRKRGIEIDMEHLALDDTKTFEMLSRGDSKGVFQLESSGFRKLLKGAKPDRFEDIIALIALYRPGPLGSGMDQAFIDRKHGREPITYLTDHLEPILGETYGCILYQEQVMRIANLIAGLSMSDADTLRKAMGKKKLDLMEKYRPAFVEGFVKKDIKAEVAEEVWSQIAFFAEYGFNKCLPASAVISNAKTGERTTIGELYANRRPFEVHALDDRWKLRSRPVTDVVSNGRKPVFELRTELGKRIVATGNHPFRTLGGWRNLEDLQVGDRIAAPRRQRVETEASWPRHELITTASRIRSEVRPSEGGVATATIARLPAEVFTLSEEDLAIFLSELMEGEQLTTGVERVARDVQALLLRVGRLSRITQPEVAFGTSVRFKVVLLDDDSTALDVQGDVFWDRVVSIEAKGVEETYDLTVDVDHNFVADGLIVHNSHSAAYGLVTYQTAYLKAHYPVEFMAATFTSWLGDTDRILEYKSECDRLGIELVPPDVNVSDVRFDVRDGKIIYGLAAIKGLGEGAAEGVVKAREKVGHFRSIFHLCGEVEAGQINRAALEALTKAGAFGSTGANRRQLAEVCEQALKMGVAEQKEKLSRQTSLFGAAQQTEADLKQVEEDLLPKVDEWRDAELLAFEKAALGFYLTQHPLDRHKVTLERFATTTLLDMANLADGAEVTVGGLVTGIRTLLDKRGNTMAFLTLEDFSGATDGVIWGSVYPDVREHLGDEAAIFIQGKVSKKREPPSVLVDKVFPMEEAEGQLRVAVSAELIVEETTEDMVRRLREVLLKNSGQDPLYYTFKRQSDNAVAGPYRVGPHFRVKGTDALREELLDLLGPSTKINIGARLG
jgi:DNA polymerase-3 subunit alpha